MALSGPDSGQRRRDRMTSVRRVLVAVAALPLLLAASACGGDPPTAEKDQTVTIVGQNFTEADIITQLYKLLLDKQGFDTDVEKLGARDSYLGAAGEGPGAGGRRLALLAHRDAQPHGQRQRRASGGELRRAGDPGPAEDPGRGVRPDAAATGQGRGRHRLRRHQGLRRAARPDDAQRPRQARTSRSRSRPTPTARSGPTAARACRTSTASRSRQDRAARLRHPATPRTP